MKEKTVHKVHQAGLVTQGQLETLVLLVAKVIVARQDLLDFLE